MYIINFHYIHKQGYSQPKKYKVIILFKKTKAVELYIKGQVLFFLTFCYQVLTKFI